jgi:chromosomal replication initiation ATPase DnaA
MTPQDIARFVGPSQAVVSEAISAVSAATGIPGNTLLSPTRTAHVARARHVAMAICRAKGMSLSEIGRAFNRDHTSVLNGLRRVQQWKEAQNGQRQ